MKYEYQTMTSEIDWKVKARVSVEYTPFCVIAKIITARVSKMHT